MSIFAYGFNHTAVLRRCTGSNSDGDVQYGEPENIRCSFVYKRRETVDKTGVKYICDKFDRKNISKAMIFTDTFMQPLDRIEFNEKTWTVLVVEAVFGFNGRVDHWEAKL